MSPSIRCLSSLTFVLACASSTCGTAFAAENAARCEPLGHVQKRVVQKAGIGVEALRNYLEITRGVHQLDMVTVAASLDAWVANARCAGLVLDEAAVRQVVALAMATR
jgi:hypothetical protein